MILAISHEIRRTQPQNQNRRSLERMCQMKKIISSTIMFLVLALVMVAYTMMVPQSKDPVSSIGRTVTEATFHDVATAEETSISGNPNTSAVDKVSKVMYENVIATNKGLTAELREIDLNPEFPTVTVCTDVPTPEDWLPEFSATYNGNEIGIWGWRWIGPGDSAYQTTYRCYQVYLTLSSAPKDFSGQFVFSLDYFRTIPPEQIPDSLIVQAKERLKNTGIDFEIENITHGVNITIISKPNSYSQEEAKQIVLEAMSEKFEGPWTFVIDLDKK